MVCNIPLLMEHIIGMYKNEMKEFNPSLSTSNINLKPFKGQSQPHPSLVDSSNSNFVSKKKLKDSTIILIT